MGSQETGNGGSAFDFGFTVPDLELLLFLFPDSINTHRDPALGVNNSPPRPKGGRMVSPADRQSNLFNDPPRS